MLSGTVAYLRENLTPHWKRVFAITLVVMIVLTIWFYRKAPGEVPQVDDLTILSPTYGQLLTVQRIKLNEHSYYCLSFRVRVHDIHRQYAPVAGTITEITEYEMATAETIPIENEFSFKKCDTKIGNKQMTHVIATKIGNVRVDQLSNAFLRRIDSFHKPGDRIELGKQLGIIHWGSRVDLYVPEVYKTNTKLYNFRPTVEASVERYDGYVRAKQPIGFYEFIANTETYDPYGGGPL